MNEVISEKVHGFFSSLVFSLANFTKSATQFSNSLSLVRGKKQRKERCSKSRMVLSLSKIALHLCNKIFLERQRASCLRMMACDPNSLSNRNGLIQDVRTSPSLSALTKWSFSRNSLDIVFHMTPTILDLLSLRHSYTLRMPKKGGLAARTSASRLFFFPEENIAAFQYLVYDMDVTGLEMVSEVTDGQGDSSRCYLAIALNT